MAESIDLCQFCSTRLLYILRLHGLVRTDMVGLLMFAFVLRGHAKLQMGMLLHH